MSRETGVTRPRIATLLAALACWAALAEPAAAQVVEGEEPNRGGTIDFSSTDPAVALERLEVAEGYEVTLFASEKDFPIGNPVALAFDSQGRLWVSTMPTYPQYKPGDPPSDRLIILEDTDGDGRADRHTVFADSLYLALGFELGDGGVYVSQQPNLVFLKDTDGDGRADERRILLHGFGTEDSHHSLSAFTWGPDGALYFQEGTFLHSQVETPYGPVRLENAGVFRYEPRTERLSVLTSYSFSNPWGHVFDRWGQNFIADASSGNNYFGLPISGHLEYPRKHPQMRVFTSVVRPTGGAEFVSSRHFPPETQGDFLITNVIGFQGIKSHRLLPEGSGFTSRETPPLLTSRDINFRPVEMEFGPDGALYLTDWFNPLIGHMQYSLRDERRDTTHGRIWRITHRDRPLLESADLTTLSVPELLDRLTLEEDRERYRVRRELRERDDAEVAAALERWIAALDPANPRHEHHLLEALWVRQGRDRVDSALLDRLLAAQEPLARAAAVRTLRYSQHRVDDVPGRLRRAVADAHPLVRLEAVVALSFIPDAEAAAIALEALRHPMDYYLNYGLGETLATLEPQWKPALLSGGEFVADNPQGIAFLLDRLSPEEVQQVPRDAAVSEILLTRDGVDEEVRSEALLALSTHHDLPRAALLVDFMVRVDGGTGEGDADESLAALLLSLPVDELRAVREPLVQLARDGRLRATRESAWAALASIDGVTAAWARTGSEERARLDLLVGLGRLPAGSDAAAGRFLREVVTGRLDPADAGALRGRYLRIEERGCCVTQSLAEVEVLDARTNHAIAGEARQKSTVSGGDANHAIDGNTSGDFSRGSVAQSVALEADPWWEVDLRETRRIDEVRIWRRTDPAAPGGPGAFTLRVLDADRREVGVVEGQGGDAQPIVLSVGGSTAVAERRAAVGSLLATGGAGPELRIAIQALLTAGVDHDLALAGAAGLAEAGAGDGALAEALLAIARAVSAADRTGPTFALADSVGRMLAERLNGEERAALLSGFERLRPLRLEVVAIEGAMRFDIEAFEVEAGREVEIVLRNPDVMPHNLVVTAPGAEERVGRAADAMATAPDAYERHFVPETSEVLFASALIGTAERTTLSFTAPETPGEYPYICTFPGHWITMRGIMRVRP